MNFILEGELFFAENNITHMPPKCKLFLKKNETVRMHLKIAGNDARFRQYAPRKSVKWAKNAVFRVLACKNSAAPV